MRWSTLFKKIGRVPIRITQNNNVYAVLQNPATGEWERVPLAVRYDAKGCLYFIKDAKSCAAANSQNGGTLCKK